MGLLLMTLQDPLKCLEEGPLVLVLWVFLLLASAPPLPSGQGGGVTSEKDFLPAAAHAAEIVLGEGEFGDLVRRRRHRQE